MTTKNTSHPIELKLADIIIEVSSDGKYIPLAGRPVREIKENAKLLAPELEAAGGWDPFQPGQVFVNDDGKYQLLAGFTRYHAATEILDWKTGFFGVDESDATTRALKCITTNGGRPVSRASQGKTYAVMTVGVVADDFKGALADPKDASHWKIPPMTQAEIADRIGKSASAVSQCIAIAEAPAQFAELLENDQIASMPYLKAKSICGPKEGLLMKWCKAAIRVADGKIATQKHFDATKAEFIQQKAVTKKDAEDKGDTAPPPPNEAPAGKESKREHQDESEQEREEETELDLSAPAPQPKPVTKAQAKSVRDALIAIIAKVAETRSLQADESDIEALADKLIASGLIASALPI